MSDAAPRPVSMDALAVAGLRGPVALVTSPHAGSAGGQHPREYLERAGVTVALSQPVIALDDGPALRQMWQAAGCVAVIAAGGDGTVGAVATHATAAGLPVGILPMGTANDVARALTIPLDLRAAARIIAGGRTRLVDAGQVVPAQTGPGAVDTLPAPSPTLDALAQSAPNIAARQLHPEPTTGGAYFLHALTLGVNVEFARLATNVRQRAQWGRLTYVISALRALERFQPVPVTLRLSPSSTSGDENVISISCEASFVAAINLPVFGGRIGLRAPYVRDDDQMLDFIVVEAFSPREMGAALDRALAALASSGSNGAVPGAFTLPGVRWVKAWAATIETPEPVEVTLDGEIRARTPVVARVAPQRVRVIAPGPPEPPELLARDEQRARA